MMRAGMLTRRLTFQIKKETRNASGEVIVAWVDDCICWGSVTPIRGREYMAAQQMQAAVSHRVKIRYRTLSDGTKINPNCRISYDSRYFNIQSVIDLNDSHVDLEIMATEET